MMEIFKRRAGSLATVKLLTLVSFGTSGEYAYLCVYLKSVLFVQNNCA